MAEWHFDVLVKNLPDGSESGDVAATIKAILDEHVPPEWDVHWVVLDKS